MHIHLLRHAEAEDPRTTDFERALTAEGREQAAIVARFLEKTDCPLDLILTSPYLRARDTARAVAAKYPGILLLEAAPLGCGMSPAAAWQLLIAHRHLKHILLVGHQPDLGELAAHLLNSPRTLEIEFDKASLFSARIALDPPSRGILRAFLSVRQMATAL